MGGKWKMPTEDQLDELYENTSKHFYTKNNVDGLIFTSRINDKQLFIPFSGTWEDYTFYTDAKSFGCIWSSDVNIITNNSAYSMHCRHRGSNILDDNRSIACSVRGVFIK